MKKVICFMMILIITASITNVPILAEEAISVLYEGELTELSDYEIHEDIIMINMRKFSSIFRTTLNYNPSTGHISFKKSGKLVDLQEGSSTVKYGKQQKDIGINVYKSTSNNQSYIPMEEILKILGFQVTWHEKIKIFDVININDIVNTKYSYVWKNKNESVWVSDNVKKYYIDLGYVESYDKLETTVYRKDGSTETIYMSDLQSYLDDGWYEEPFQTLYAADGRKKIFPKSQVKAQLAVGWYENPVKDSSSKVYYLDDSLVEMYALDGRTKTFKKSEIYEQLAVGWYLDKFIYMRKDNRELRKVPFDKVNIYNSNGWKEVKEFFNTQGERKYITVDESNDENKSLKEDEKWYSEPVCLLFKKSTWGLGGYEEKVVTEKEWNLNPARYSGYEEGIMLFTKDGKSKLYPNEKAMEQTSVGWYNDDIRRLYTPDGRSKIFPANKVAEQLNVGWYEDPVQRLYAPDGRSEIVSINKVKEQLNVGWYEEPFVKMYTLDGRTAIFKESEAYAQINVGWYEDVPQYILDAIKVNDYNSIFDWLTTLAFEYYQMNNDVAYTYMEQAKDVLEKWRKENSGPLAVIARKVGSEYGIPEVAVTFRNISDKVVVSLETKFTCYDAYGNITTDYPNLYNGTFIGYADNENIDPGESVTLYWSLYSNERTTNTSWPIVKRVAYSDGTVWYR